MTPGPYHLLSIGALLLVSYFISLLFVRKHLLTLQSHRKFWNTLLLLFFLSTALLGLLLVVKVNYKLNVSWIEDVMQWHVDSGIGFALVALFHLLWHLRYYSQRKPSSPGPAAGISPSTPRSPLSLPFSRLQESSFFLLLGYISILAQLVLLREFIKSFHGNELVIGIFLAAWMILTARGASLGAMYRVKIPQQRLCLLLVLLGLLPLLVYLALILTGRFLFLPGVQAGLLDTTICMLILSALFTGVSGFLFGYVSGRVEHHKTGASPYRLDAIGSVAGGILFGVILVHLLNNIQLLTFLFMTTSLAVVLLFRYPARPAWRIILLLSSIVLFILSLPTQFQNSLEELRYRDEKVLETRDTPYGNLTFSLRDDQVTAFMDGNPVISSSDLTGAEESVHFPALQHPGPESFLLLGGGLSGHIAEASKYNPARIDYCEANPWIYRMGKTHFTGSQPEELRFIPQDGRRWLMQAEDVQYDIVVSSASNPITIGWNRYFTLEFYSMVKEHLAPGGIFCMQLSTSDNYVNEEGIGLLAINYNTMEQLFAHVVIVPGTSTYFLASDRELSLDFPAMVLRRQIQTTYVHPDYLDANHIRFDSEQLFGRIQQENPQINSDLWPRLFFATLTGIESKYGSHSTRFTGILSALLFLFLLFRYTPVKRAMYITGFTGAGIQIILIMVVQSFYGFAYMVAPMMITLFMAGIVAGTITGKRARQKASMTKLTGLLMIMALVALGGFILPGTGWLFDSHLSGQIILGLLNFVPGMVVGSVYAMGAGIKKELTQGIRGELYSADLTGAALGTFIPVLFLLPLIGVSNTFILFFCINLATGLSLLVRGVLKLR
ncbi:MAG: hypothetical protein GY790_15440 [Bacteroidetes bacterium]|nr:hypothetical protein [Bacteroidota bacterium]